MNETLPQLKPEWQNLVEAYRDKLSQIDDVDSLLAPIDPIDGGDCEIFESGPLVEDAIGDFAFVRMDKELINTPEIHPDDEWEIHFGLKGKASIYVDDQPPFRLDPGDVVHVPPGSSHYIVRRKGSETFVEGVLNLVKFNEDKAINLLENDTPEGSRFNRDLYMRIAAKAGRIILPRALETE